MLGTGYRLQDPVHRMQDARYRIQVTGDRMPGTGYRLQATRCAAHDAGYRIQVAGHRLQDAR